VEASSWCSSVMAIGIGRGSLKLKSAAAS